MLCQFNQNYAVKAWIEVKTNIPHLLQCRKTAAIPSDNLDNDCDGLVDEEVIDGLDNDGDGFVDEDFIRVSNMKNKLPKGIKFSAFLLPCLVRFSNE